MVQQHQECEIKAESVVVEADFGDNDGTSNGSSSICSGSGSGNDSNASYACKRRRKNQGVACCFCKRRRKRCDGGFPQCGACVNAGIQCTFVDKITGRELPRDYIDRLESKVFELESQVPLTEKSVVGLVIQSQFKEKASQDRRRSVERAMPLPLPLRPSYETGMELLQLYREIVHRQYPFLEWSWMLECFRKVFVLDSTDTEAIPFVYLVLSVGVDLREPARGGTHPSSVYYSIAMEHISATLEAGTIRTVQLYLLLLIQLLVKPKEQLADDYNQLWLLAGVAVRTAVALDLHRKPGSPRGMTHGLEQHLLQNLRSRVFWCAYSIERLIGMALGRPFCISDVDIDAPLPESELEVKSMSESEEEVEVHMYANAIEIFKLRRIQSSICMFVYGPRKFLDNDDEINQSRQQIVLELEDWKQGFTSQKLNKETNFVSTETWANINYHQSVVWFLRPLLLQINEAHKNALEGGRAMVPPTPEMLEWFQVLVYSASEIGSCYEDIFKESSSPLSHNIDPLTAIHSLFVAGVTYMYCIWLNVKLDLLSGKQYDNNKSIPTIKLYQRLLVAQAKKWPLGKLQYETFLHLSGKILTNIQRTGSSRFHSTNNLSPMDKTTLINDPTSDCESTSSLQSFAKNLNHNTPQPDAIKDSPIYSFINLNGDTLLKALLWDLLEQFE
ncbi:unnamed protein product [Kluyveromyces dobzhanskii CBS 2104]|uniref:WGS project CCBQ000000000 data, contig 00012 n=1 Tax=Kluyveromyces dobzhanskii CBS 2104 TaxID=1427455 RepID=A0A0A8L325_9SACH|nr:unnamed protein product [Kluyveromyces dobzhanskii CBS 2104]